VASDGVDAHDRRAARDRCPRPPKSGRSLKKPADKEAFVNCIGERGREGKDRSRRTTVLTTARRGSRRVRARRSRDAARPAHESGSARLGFGLSRLRRACRNGCPGVERKRASTSAWCSTCPSLTTSLSPADEASSATTLGADSYRRRTYARPMLSMATRTASAKRCDVCFLSVLGLTASPFTSAEAARNLPAARSSSRMLAISV
jgi:hypothetical protein